MRDFRHVAHESIPRQPNDVRILFFRIEKTRLSQPPKEPASVSEHRSQAKEHPAAA